MQDRTIRLKTLFTSLVVLLTTLVLSTSAALILSTTFLRGTSDRLHLTLESVRISDQMRAELLSYQRASNMLSLTGDDAFLRDRDSAARTLHALLREARGYVSTPKEAAVLDQVEHEISAYLRERSAAEQQGHSLEAVLRATSARTDGALDALQDLVTINMEQANEARAHAAWWDRLGNIWGTIEIIALGLGLVLVLYALRTQVYRPLLGLQRALHSFAHGDRRSRASEVGPTELRDIARAFNGMADSLAEQHNRQLAFLSGVAHDLRNPLSALKISVGLLAPGRPLPKEQNLRQIATLLDKQIDRLNRMVGDLLDTTRIEAGQLDLRLEPCDLREIAQAVVALYQPMATEHQLCLSLPAEQVLASCDPTRLEQVLGNLVSNAIKYSKGGRVEVSLRGGEREAILSVSDQGIGISPEAQQTIFEPFQRAGATALNIPGVGLGLSVARRIIEAHHGNITVESCTGKGSIFQVRLPISQRALEPSMPESALILRQERAPS